MHTRISLKLILPLGIISVFIIGVFSYFLLRSQQQALTSAVEHNAHQISETIKSATKEDMLLNHRERLHRAIDDIAAQDGIEKIRIFNKEGRIIYSSDKSLLGTMVDKRAEACFACHAADQALERLPIPDRTRRFQLGNSLPTLGIINPIYNEPSCSQASCHAHESTQKVLGVLDVTMSLAEVERQFVAARNKLLLLEVTAVTALAAILWLLLSRLVGKPLGQLVEATEALASGDLGYRVPVTRKDEFGVLEKSFNTMTERLAQAQEQLVQSDKLASVGRLAAGVAHEINNPLTGVLSYSSFLLKRAPEDSEMRKDLETIVQETKRCREIVKQLLDFSRQVPSKMSAVDLTEVAEDALNIVSNRLNLDNIRVVRNFEPELPIISADRNQILQVFINLLVNAADAIGGEGGEISISARAATASSEVEVKVEDNGCGIPRDAVSRVFEPFYSTKEHEGTGLGLSVAWGIMDRHGGKIQIDSEVDRGTTVTLRFPLRTTPAVTQGSPAS